MLLRDSANLKLRAHAAYALASVRDRKARTLGRRLPPQTLTFPSLSLLLTPITLC